MPRSRLRLILIALTAAALLAALVVGIVGLLRGAPEGAVDAAPTSPTIAVTPAPAPDASTSDPERFARAIAEQLYVWDTQRTTQDRIVTGLLSQGDGDDTLLANLAADIRRHLPTTEQWTQLLELDAAQTLRIDHAEMPEVWAGIAEESADELPPGAVAINIGGSIHRTGTWHDETVVADAAVAFTVFAACPPLEQCHLLRLSLPGAVLGEQ
jgi:hypothetical protein